MPFRYLLFNKPFRVLCQFTAVESKRTLADFIDVPGVYPIGRLDYDSEGLLFLTDDGQLQHSLGDPRYEHPRTYWVQVEGQITAEALECLRSTVVIQGYRTRPCEASIRPEPSFPPRDPPVRFRKSIPTSWIELTLTEGKNRQVRHMTAAVGFPTLRLIRVSIGPLLLGDLAPGQRRELSLREITHLKNSIRERRRGSKNPKIGRSRTIPNRYTGK